MQPYLRHADWTSPFWSRDDWPRDHRVRGAGATRRGWTRLLGEVSNWRDSQGRLALVPARKLLPKLAPNSGFRLPAAKPGVPDATATGAGPEGLETLSGLRCGLQDLGSVGHNPSRVSRTVPASDSNPTASAISLSSWSPIPHKFARRLFAGTTKNLHCSGAR